jgi:hydrogenase maturation factor
VPGRIVELLPAGMASVEFDHGIQEVNVELISCAPGDVVLVHAGFAIAVSTV